MINLPDLLKSKRFWAAIIFGVIVALNDFAQLGLSPAQIEDYKVVVLALIFGYTVQDTAIGWRSAVYPAKYSKNKGGIIAQLHTAQGSEEQPPKSA